MKDIIKCYVMLQQTIIASLASAFDFAFLCYKVRE